MPDKRYTRGCGKSCTRCWINRLNHGSKLKKKCFPKMFEDSDEEEIEPEEVNIEEKIDEFFNKFIDITYTYTYTSNKIIDKNNINQTEENINLLDIIVESYNHWIYEEMKITTRLKHNAILNKLKKIYKDTPRYKKSIYDNMYIYIEIFFCFVNKN